MILIIGAHSQDYATLYKNDFNFDSMPDIDKELFTLISNVNPTLVYEFERYQLNKGNVTTLEGVRGLKTVFNEMIRTKKTWARHQLTTYKQSSLKQTAFVKRYFTQDFSKDSTRTLYQSDEMKISTDANKQSYYVYKHLENNPELSYDRGLNYSQLIEDAKGKKRDEIINYLESYKYHHESNSLVADVVKSFSTESRALISNYYYIFEPSEHVFLKHLIKLGAVIQTTDSFTLNIPESKSHLYGQLSYDSEFQNLFSDNVIDLESADLTGTYTWYDNNTVLSEGTYDVNLFSGIQFENVNLVNLSVGYFFNLKEKKGFFSYLDVSASYSFPLSEGRLVTELTQDVIRNPINGSNVATLTNFSKSSFDFSRFFLSFKTPVVRKLWYFEGVLGLNISIDSYKVTFDAEETRFNTNFGGRYATFSALNYSVDKTVTSTEIFFILKSALLPNLDLDIYSIAKLGEGDFTFYPKLNLNYTFSL